jgi:hypothetical protein
MIIAASKIMVDCDTVRARLETFFSPISTEDLDKLESLQKYLENIESFDVN